MWNRYQFGTFQRSVDRLPEYIPGAPRLIIHEDRPFGGKHQSLSGGIGQKDTDATHVAPTVDSTRLEGGRLPRFPEDHDRLVADYIMGSPGSITGDCLERPGFGNAIQ